MTTSRTERVPCACCGGCIIAPCGELPATLYVTVVDHPCHGTFAIPVTFSHTEVDGGETSWIWVGSVPLDTDFCGQTEWTATAYFACSTSSVGGIAAQVDIESDSPVWSYETNDGTIDCADGIDPFGATIPMNNEAHDIDPTCEDYYAAPCGIITHVNGSYVVVTE